MAGMFIVESGTVVSHGHQGGGLVTVDGDFDDAARRHGMHGVFDEVGHDLFNQQGVKGGFDWRAIEYVDLITGAVFRFESGRESGLGEGAQVELLHFGFPGARVEEQLLYRFFDPAHLPERLGDDVFSGIIGREGFANHLERPADSGERISDFMGDGRPEFAQFRQVLVFDHLVVHAAHGGDVADDAADADRIVVLIADEDAPIVHPAHLAVGPHNTVLRFAAAGDSSPLAGVVETGRNLGWEFVPVIDMRAMPGGTVEDAAVEHFWGAIEETAARVSLSELDGVFLVLHGAMASESFTDVEGEMLERLRGLAGARELPVCGVLDLHANFTERMARLSDGLVAYRENPHTDAKKAAEDAAHLLDRLMRTGERPVTAWERVPAMWPPTGTGTASDPLRAVEEGARAMERDHNEVAFVNVCSGCAFTDAPETSACLTAITFGSPELLREPLGRLRDLALRKRHAGNQVDRPVEEVLPLLARHTEGPVVLVEPSDNVGGGAPGDGTGLLRFLVEHAIRDSVVVINDPLSVAEAHVHRVGERLTLDIGGRGSRFDAGPLRLEVDLISKSDGRFELEDQQSHLASMFGSRIDMGACAVVRHGGVRVLLTSRKTPPFDLGQLRSQGIVPESCFVIGVKAAVAHRRAYDPITRASYTVDTPGPCSSNLKRFPYRHIQRPIFPLDDLAEWPADA